MSEPRHAFLRRVCDHNFEQPHKFEQKDKWKVIYAQDIRSIAPLKANPKVWKLILTLCVITCIDSYRYPKPKKATFISIHI